MIQPIIHDVCKPVVSGVLFAAAAGDGAETYRYISSGDIIYRRRKNRVMLYIDYSDNGGVTWELNIYSALLSEDVIAVTIDSSPAGYREAIRDGAYKIDFELTSTGFAGTEDVDWENVWSTMGHVNMPSGLTLSIISTGVQVDWIDNSFGNAQTEIWGQSDGAAYALLYTINAGTETKDDALDPVDLRYYKIRSVNGGIYSDFTSPVSIAMLGPEKLLNPNITGATSWNVQAGWSILDGEAIAVNTSSSLFQYSVLDGSINGDVFRIRVNIIEYTSGIATYQIGVGAQSWTPTGPGVYTFFRTFTANASNTFYLFGTNVTMKVSSISLKKKL
jgi:hypothetical protein